MNIANEVISLLYFHHNRGGYVKELLTLLVFVLPVSRLVSISYDAEAVWNERSSYGKEGSRLDLARAFHDLGQLTCHLWSIDSLLVMVPYAPFFGIAASFDDEIHRHYYCHAHHKNLHTHSKSLYEMSDILVGLTLGTLAACSFSHDERLQRTAQLYAISLPLTWGFKSLIKKIGWDGNCRPLNEWFEQKKVYGGFPSGHMLEMMYATVLFGLEIGIGAFVPLAVNTAVVAVSFLKYNRHYASQLVAGAALGTAIGYAAHHALEYNPQNCPISFSVQPGCEKNCLMICGKCRF